MDTAGLSDGVHVLDFIARDGSAVAAQSRFSLPLVVGNESPQLAVLGTNGEGVVNNDLPDLTKGTDFGPVEWGASRTNTLAIGNDGPASLSIAGWSTTGPGTDTFQVVGIPALIEAGVSPISPWSSLPPSPAAFRSRWASTAMPFSANQHSVCRHGRAPLAEH